MWRIFASFVVLSHWDTMLQVNTDTPLRHTLFYPLSSKRHGGKHVPPGHRTDLPHFPDRHSINYTIEEFSFVWRVYTRTEILHHYCGRHNHPISFLSNPLRAKHTNSCGQNIQIHYLEGSGTFRQLDRQWIDHIVHLINVYHAQLIIYSDLLQSGFRLFCF